MNVDAKYFLLLSRALHLDSDDESTRALARELAADDIDWKRFLELADHEHMTSALAAALRRRNLHTSLPRPIKGALDRRHFMGMEINGRIKRQIEEMVETLNSIGVTPLLMKGALFLCEAAPDELAGRVLRDLDLMVPAESLEDCVDALKAKDYVPQGEDEGWTYHYRPMYHRDHIVGIELHVRPGEQRHFMGVEEAWENAVPVNLPGLDAVALGPSNRVAHNIFHSEVQDFGHVLATLCLRQLYDLARICQRHQGEIDWPAVLIQMERHGMAAMFRARMHQAVELLGAPRPNIKVDDLRSRIHLSRCLAQLRWPGVTNLMHWLAGIFGPISSRHLDLIYNCGTKGLSMHVRRVKHAWSVIKSHRGDFSSRIAERGRRLQ
jgi:hypothetical protein